MLNYFVVIIEQFSVLDLINYFSYKKILGKNKTTAVDFVACTTQKFRFFDVAPYHLKSNTKKTSIKNKPHSYNEE